MRTGNYYRMSTDEQSTSIDAQRLLVERYAADFGLKFAGEYSDAGIPGDATAAQRPDFLRMLADAAAGKLDAVLVRDTSRLTRSDSIDGAVELEPLKKAGVLILTTTGQRIDLRTMEGRIMLAMGNEISNGENRNRAVAVTNGQLHAALAGSFIGMPPWGYRTEGPKKNRRLVVVEDEAAIVRRMFHEYDKGRSGEAIAAGLNRDGLRTKKGKPWSRDTVMHMLRNEAYAGDYVFNKQHQGKYQGIAGGKVASNIKRGMNPESELIIHRDHHEPLVSREQFDRVQSRLALNPSCKAPVDSFLLSSRLRCAKCDHAMWGRTMRSGSRFYICGSCKATVSEREAVERLLASLRFAPDELREIEEELRGHFNPEDGRHLERLQKELARQKKKLVVLDADLLSPIQADIRRIQQEISISKRKPGFQMDAERAIREAMERIAQLPTLAVECPKTFRAYVRETISHYRVWIRRRGEGRRSRYSMERGVVRWNLDTGPGEELKVYPPACVEIAVA